MSSKEKILDLIIIGGGQSALACGYYLRRTDIDYVTLDAESSCGGAWQHAWKSLTLFSPAEHSSLPGWMMPESEGEFPSREEVISYLCDYEKRYKLPVQRPVKVLEVSKNNEIFTLKTTSDSYRARAVISATGTFGKPFIPNVPGRENFQGKQLQLFGIPGAG
ncbi:MAG: NAD(P)-binding domain-containing protein [Owenweeksia sp.]|nr:NAD(P)-binding domain-containing protein [Owenweeksia sp.]